MIVVFVPLLLTGGNPLMGASLGVYVGFLIPEIPPVIGMMMGLGFLTTPTLVGLAVLYHRHQQYRSCNVDQRGVVFGRTAKWEGQRIRWDRLTGFQITGNGIMLTVAGKPWTRWLGPTIQSEERVTDDVVAFLESIGVPRLDG